MRKQKYVYDSGTNCTFVFMHMNIADNEANNIEILSKYESGDVIDPTPYLKLTGADF